MSGVGDLENAFPCLSQDADLDAPPARSGVGSVPEQVPEHLPELTRIGPHPDGRIGLRHELDAALGELLPEQLHRLHHGAGSVERLERGRNRPREGEELAHQGLQPLRLAAHDAHQAALLLVQAGRGAENLDRAAHRSERIADLVREARCQAADHGEAVGAADRFLHLAQLGEILEEDDLSGGPAGERRHRVSQDPIAAVVRAQAHFGAAALAGPCDRPRELGQEGFQRLAAGGAVGHAGEVLGGRIQVGDAAVLSECEDPAGDGAHHGGIDGFQRFQPRFAPQ